MGRAPEGSPGIIAIMGGRYGCPEEENVQVAP